MNNTIKIQAIGQGAAGQFLPNFDAWKIFCNKMQFSSNICVWLWNDPFYGLSDSNNFEPWVSWFYKSDIDSGIALTKYFALNEIQIYQLSNLFTSWFKSVSKILDNWYCNS